MAEIAEAAEEAPAIHGRAPARRDQLDRRGGPARRGRARRRGRRRGARSSRPSTGGAPRARARSTAAGGRSSRWPTRPRRGQPARARVGRLPDADGRRRQSVDEMIDIALDRTRATSPGSRRARASSSPPAAAPGTPGADEPRDGARDPVSDRVRPRVIEKPPSLVRTWPVTQPASSLASQPTSARGVLRRSPAAERQPPQLVAGQLGRRPAGVGRARVDRVDEDAARREVRGERRGERRAARPCWRRRAARAPSARGSGRT